MFQIPSVTIQEVRFSTLLNIKALHIKLVKIAPIRTARFLKPSHLRKARTFAKDTSPLPLLISE